MVRDLPHRQFQQRFSTDLNQLPQVVQWLSTAKPADCPETVWQQVNMALIEGFSNAVRHAHRQLPPETPIDVRLALFSQRLQLMIWDWGPPFDLEAALQGRAQTLQRPDYDPLAQERQWGVQIFLKLRQEFGWRIALGRTENDRNCLTFEKQFEAPHRETEVSES
ncbi:ATP-binding protein [Lyngbya confervoides]|uniref:ATP-binding protein n=1 Tax=Lyngbya confervoides BDU141951 TaxID=1574623 RepID=A0ABD4SZA1_9CYAN|nr:ATP-binding protein [Lyngbya confervoides]MCM1981593.1 ATP-binding protein [Lyngbya confervoides BDU141951]